MPKDQFNVRLSDEGWRLVELLGKRLGVTKTAVIELALRAYARLQKIK